MSQYVTGCKITKNFAARQIFLKLFLIRVSNFNRNDANLARSTRT